MSSSTPRQSSRTPLVIGVIAAAVVLLAVVAIIVAAGGDDGETGGNGGAPPPATSRQPAEFRGEARDVEIEGDALPPYVQAVGPDPAIGMRPPLLVAEDAGGTVHTISPDIAGPTLLVFLAHWCPACNSEVPSIIRVSEAGGFPDDLNVYAVLTGIAPDRPNFPPSRWIADFDWPYVAVADGLDLDVSPATWAASEAFGLTAYPYSVLVVDGVVVDRWTGELGDANLAARIDSHVS